MARYLLLEKSLPKEFWAEAANTTVFLLNKLPTKGKAVEGKTPFEPWYGFKPSLKNHKLFGCLFFVHVVRSREISLIKEQNLVYLWVIAQHQENFNKQRCVLHGK